MDELLQERFTLAKERIAEIEREEISNEAVSAYFKKAAAWMSHMFETYELVEAGTLYEMDMAALKKLNARHYEEVLSENYAASYANPTYAVKELGEALGGFLSAMYVELRREITFAYGSHTEEFVAMAELFLELAGAFSAAWEEKKLPEYEEVRQIYYWYMSDYAELRAERQVRGMVVPQEDYLKKIIMKSDLSDLRYLYWYGKYVSDCELRTAAFLNTLPEETIITMADTFTEGYRIGFVTTGKDLSIKKSAGIYFNLGFERMIRKAIANLKKIGLDTVIAADRSCESTPANRQFAYDHKDDAILFFDKQYVNRRLEAMRHAFEQHKEAAAGYAGPAVVEVFGEEPFAPAVTKEALKADDKFRKLSVEFASAYSQLNSEYIKDEERSFTIIAFPTTSIGDKFEEIFDEIIKINTLDYKLYQGIQQSLIDVLDTAEYVEVKGMNGNRTDVKVMLHPVKDAAKETKFENCVADVNIPVGEVFTSPVLTGTEGTLHVSRVFLNELEYRDLEITFRDGMIADYRCGNFEDEEEGKKYLKENVLMNHESLPLGEFAIGTNTTAYVMAQKYDIGAKLPILIAEKMGPHFAVGDTCYSHTEDVKVYNPDGKEIIARENEVSAKRNEDMAAAYLNCHTDITIPYHELGELTAVRADGSREVLIKDGRFVLAGCEELNRPFDN